MSAPSERYDIVIIGAGPVGLLLSTCLARWGHRVKIIDNRSEPTPAGRADGIQPRSLDLLRNMGLKSAIMAHKPARVYEVAFWGPGDNGIRRTGTWASCPKFIDARYPFTTLLHQGLIERVFIADLTRNGVTVQRPWTIDSFTTDSPISPTHPVTVHLSHTAPNTARQTIHAKYLFSGEGARSLIRQRLGIQMRYYDAITHIWGVMDGLVRTTFPDIKMKCTIHSPSGSVMVIPREHNLVRLYIQLASSSDPDWDPRRTASAEEVQDKAKRIMRPYLIDWESVDWYSVYPIGQGIAERYTLDERVLLGGDACHTHSPKAGQGMNTAFLDAQNLAWKVHAVESGFARREALLPTYESERKHVAEKSLEFDNMYARLFSERTPSAREVGKVNAESPNQEQEQAQGEEEDEGETPFIRAFKESCEFTSGYGVAYPPNILNYSPSHPAATSHSSLFLTHPDDGGDGDGGTPLRTGRIMPPATVTRVTDANVVALEQEIGFDGAFRVFVYAGRLPLSPTINTNAKPNADSGNSSMTPKQALKDFALASLRPTSFLGAHLRRDVADPALHHAKDCVHSKMVTFATVFDARRSDVDIDGMVPPLLAGYRDRVYADDDVGEGGGGAHRKVVVGGGGRDGDGGEGVVVVVRPDGYVGCVVRLVEGTGTVDALDAYFGGFVVGVGGGGSGDGDGGGGGGGKGREGDGLRALL